MDATVYGGVASPAQLSVPLATSGRPRASTSGRHARLLCAPTKRTPLSGCYAPPIQAVAAPPPSSTRDLARSATTRHAVDLAAEVLKDRCVIQLDTPLRCRNIESVGCNRDTILGMADEPNAWASWLRREIERRGITNMALAEAAGVDKATVGKWLSGKSSVRSHEIVRAVADALGVDVKNAYLAAGVLRPDDLQVHVVEKPLAELASADLVAELAARLDRLENPPRRTRADMLPPRNSSLPAPRPELRQSDHDLAARRRSGRKGADPLGLDDGEE